MINLEKQIPVPPIPPPKPKMKKPPLGIMPKSIWITARFDEIKSAIQRYMDDNYTIPTEWIEEYNELVKLIKQ